MAGLATSVAWSGRQTGITLGVAISGTIMGSSASASASAGVWWMVIVFGFGVLALGLLSTGRWARASAERAVALFEQVEQGPSTTQVVPRAAA